MRALIRMLTSRMVQSSAGRWLLTAILLLIGVAGLVAYPNLPASESSTDGSTALVTGVVFVGLGLAMLAFTIRLELLLRRARRARRSATVRVNELQASGQLLPIPALPPPPQGVSPSDLATVEGYAERMAKLPWGDAPQVPAADAAAVFNRTVARVRRVRGDWSELGEPIDTFVGLPRPLCWAGAAEIMHRLSYLSAMTYAPMGLRQGLRFVARGQVNEPMQPDLLVIRTKLLAATSAKQWLALADQTLDILRRVAPDHPRLPDAESAIHLRRGEYESALACYDRLIANPPSPEEAFVAEANRASALERLQRYDEALDAHARVLRLDPGDAWTWHNLSILLLKLDRVDEALDANTRALAIMDFGNARDLRQRILARRAQLAGGAQAD